MINIRNVREGVARRPFDCQSVAGGLASGLCPPLSFRHFYIKNRKTVPDVSLNYTFIINRGILKTLFSGSFVVVGCFFFYLSVFNGILRAKRVTLSMNTKKKPFRNILNTMLKIIIDIECDWMSLIVKWNIRHRH